MKDAIRTHNRYRDQLREAERYVRNAAMTEIINADNLADESEISSAWVGSWESRILTMLRSKSESHAAILPKLREIVERYEGYGE